ncbi:MAG: hypothetical protein Q9160_000962 [Pyrenula sp. 1 TL-2023]
MPHSRASSYGSDDSFGTPIQIIRTQNVNDGHHGRHRRRSPDRPAYWSGEFLALPGSGGGGGGGGGGTRIHRSASTGARPQPQIVIDVNANRRSSDEHSRSRSRSRSHERRRSRSRRRHLSESDDDEDLIFRPKMKGKRSEDGIIHVGPPPPPHHGHGPPGPHHHGPPRRRSPSLDYETRKKLEKLDLLEEAEKEKDRAKRLKEKMELERAKEEIEKMEKAEKEKKLRKQYVEDWKREEDEKKRKEKEKKEEEDRVFEDRVKQKFMTAGYSEDYIEDILHKRKHKVRENTMALERTKPVWIKVQRKHLLPETLERWELPWEYDTQDDNYIIIKKWVSDTIQQDMFDHTRQIKQRKAITAPPIEIERETRLYVNDKKKDKLYMVRKKSPNRRSWIFS